MAAWLTVVVPIHDVAPYLAACLESIAGQTHRELDVVLVDDGSTDGSGEIAARFAAQDARFRLLRQANAGLGAARNAGAAVGDGDYLSFVDADDVLPPYAFEALVGALERSGSDLATGDVALLADGALRPSRLHRGTHRTTRLGIRLADQRNLVYDRLACNKVYRRAFWDRHGLRFPEGVVYEDIPVTVPAYALAAAVDVVALPVYHWRQRPAGDPSLSGRLAETSSMADRFAAVSSVRRALAAAAPGSVGWYDAAVLRSDLRMVLDLAPSASESYRRLFLALAAQALSMMDDRTIKALPPRLRAAWRAVAEGRVPPPVGAAAATPAAPYAVSSVSWSRAGGSLLLRGAAPAGVLPGAVWLRSAGRRRVVRPFLRRRYGFAVAVDARRLAPGEWTVNAGPPRTRLGTGDARPALPARWIGEGVRVAPLVRAGVLRISVSRPAVVASELELTGSHLLIRGRGEAAELRLERVEGVPWRSYPLEFAVDGTWTCCVPLDDLPVCVPTRPLAVGERPAQWRMAVAPGPGAPATPLVVAAGAAEMAREVGGLLVLAGPDDDLVVRVRAVPPSPLAKAAAVRRRRGVLALAGTLAPPDLRLRLQPVDGSPLLDEVTAQVDEGGAWRAELPLGGLTPGEWLPLWRGGPDEPPADLLFAAALRAALPLTARVRGRRVTLRADQHAHTLLVTPR